MIRSNSDYHSQLIILQINYWFSIYFYNKDDLWFQYFGLYKNFFYTAWMHLNMKTRRKVKCTENKNSSKIKTKKIKICFDTQNEVNYS